MSIVEVWFAINRGIHAIHAGAFYSVEPSAERPVITPSTQSRMSWVDGVKLGQYAHHEPTALRRYRIAMQ